MRKYDCVQEKCQTEIFVERGIEKEEEERKKIKLLKSSYQCGLIHSNIVLIHSTNKNSIHIFSSYVHT